MNREQISEAARTLVGARRDRCRVRDTQTVDMFGGGNEYPPREGRAQLECPSEQAETPGRSSASASPKPPRRKKPAAAPDVGAALRDQGIARAAESAGDEWHEQALRLVRIHATFHATVTCDGMRLWAEATGFDRPPEARAWGAVMLAAKRERVLEPTDRFEASADPACHKSPVRVWRSLVHAGAAA